MINVSDTVHDIRRNVHSKAALGASAYETFSAMMRVNIPRTLNLPPYGVPVAGADERLVESHEQMLIEQRLNKVGRGRLLSSRQTTRGEYVNALHELDSFNVDYRNGSPDLNISCMYILLRLNPAICLLKLDGTSYSGDYKS
jgi:hypothetical protein